MNTFEQMGLPGEKERLDESLKKLPPTMQETLKKHLKDFNNNDDEVVITPQMRKDAAKHAAFHNPRQQD